MRALWSSLGLTVTAGALATLGVDAFPLEPGVHTSALLGVGIGTAIGLLALVIKTQLLALLPQGGGAVRAVLLGQVLTLFLRLLAVLAGALALRSDPASSPTAYVLAFFTVYLAQQFIEVRTLLAARPGKPEVTPT